ncbi:MAG TPA: hypothetical protein VMM58_03230 [Bacteroidota bacterium]|nr:hypothetical protein [Bacteroidota bacterium]
MTSAKCFVAVLVFISTTTAQGQKYYFYHPNQDYGSEGYYNPITMMINGSYDILRNGAHSKDVFDQPYFIGMRNVWQNISSPLYNISHYGWGRFDNEELFNLQLNSQTAQFVPNFSDHTLGEGMLYAKTAEWYDYHGFSYPYLWSFVTTSAYQFMNETIENGSYEGTSVDCISDMLIYNTAGFILFSINDVKDFFSSTLPVYDWSLQPVIDPTDGHLFNAGEQFVMKHNIPFVSPKYSAFLYWGIHAIVGMSYAYDDENNISIGAGQVAERINENRYKGLRFLTPTLDGAVGVFYDRNNSLMTSLLLSGPRLPNAQINVYPGLVKWGWFEPGMFLAFGQWDKFVLGVTFANIPFGLARGTPYDPYRSN